MAAGGRVLDDRTVKSGAVLVPLAAERVVVVAQGQAPAAVGGRVAGWCGGQSLPTVGWRAAICGGAVVTAQGSRIAHNRERGDGGWANTTELATAAQVVTVFAGAVNAVAVV